ncbi:hypothetical protein CDAR_237481 [Caerostris darwini]|uniref:Uncharacterized protein n=1 Tax=Caerostris darwini TaxID=1538125 RepID=A0AAV4QTK8_9ARAC|nr:hypothetical protein CDAR_237481 [Caerostris darwini]
MPTFPFTILPFPIFLLPEDAAENRRRRRFCLPSITAQQKLLNPLPQLLPNPYSIHDEARPSQRAAHESRINNVTGKKVICGKLFEPFLPSPRLLIPIKCGSLDPLFREGASVLLPSRSHQSPRL